MINGSSRDIIRWLHLSDFHVGKDDYGEKTLFKHVLDHVSQKKKDGFTPDLIFITGDVAYNGADGQYKAFESKFLQLFYKIIGKEKQACTFFVPGNHDINREIYKHLNRVSICKMGSRFFDPTVQGFSERQQVLPRFEAYINNPYLTPKGWINSEAGCYAKSIEVRGTFLGILGINTAWLSLNAKDRHKLSPGINLIQEGFEKLQNCNHKIILGHHPIDWFRDEQISEIKTILGNHNALYLHGHLHKVRANLEGEGFLCIQSGAAFVPRKKGKWVNGLLWAELDLSRFVLRLQPRQWNPDNNDWAYGIDLPVKRKVEGTDWWEFSLPGITQPRVAFPLSEIRNQNGIQPKYNDYIGFAGRKKEIKEFYQFLASQDLVLNYHGRSGIGKSFLLNHLLNDLSTGRISSEHISVHIDCKEISVDLLAFMERVARNIGEKRLPNYFKWRNKYFENLDADFLSNLLVDDLFDKLFSDLQPVSKIERIIIFLDSFEKFQGTILEDRLITALNRFSDNSSKGLKVVIGGLEPIRASRGWVSFRYIEIKPFSIEDLEEFAEKNLYTRNDAVISYLKDEWNGNPLELGQLVGRYIKENCSTSALQLSQLRRLRAECIIAADSEFMERLRERLGAEDTEALSCCAVPKWFDASVLRTITNSDFATSRCQFERLAQLSWVKPRSCGIGYEIHELYRGPLLRNLIQGDIELFSVWSERYYEYLNNHAANRLASAEISCEIDSVYHLMAFNEDEALFQYNDLRYRLEQRNRLDLMTFFQNEIEGHLKINPNINSIFQQWIHYGRATIHYMGYDDDIALSEYEQMLKDPALDDFLRGRVLRAKGDLLHSQEGKGQMAKTCYMEAIKIWGILITENTKSPGVDRDDILKSLAETYTKLARIEEIQGNLMEGMNHFSLALDSYRQCDTLGPSYGRTLKWMGRNLRFLGKWKEAHHCFNKAEDVFNNLLMKAKSGDIRLSKRVDEIKDGLLNVQNARAALWKEEGRWMEAKEVLEQVISFYNKNPEETGNQEPLGIALIDLGDVLRMEGNIIDAKRAYKKAQKNLKRSKVNQGYPLLGLAEIATIEAEEKKALKYLSQAEKKFTKFDYARKVGEIELCQAKLSRKVNINVAIKNLEEAWEKIRETEFLYTKSSILVELSELIYESDGNSERCRNYRMQAMASAGQEQGPFAEHIARLCFLDGRIAGKEKPLDALPAFVESLDWAVRHNIITLERTVSNCKTWLHGQLSAKIGLAFDNEEMRNRKAETVLRESEEKALSTLSEKLKSYFKNAVKELKDSIHCDQQHFYISHWIKPPCLNAGKYSMSNLKLAFSNINVSFFVRGNITVSSYHYIRHQYKIEALLVRPNVSKKLPTIIYINGFGKTALDFFSRCITFARAGFSILAITMPGFGKSEGPRDWVGSKTIESIAEGYRKIQKEFFVDTDRIGIFGFSRGALAAAVLATGNLKFKAAIFAAGVYDFLKAYNSATDEEMKNNMRRESGMTEKDILERSPIFAMGNIQCPVLILHGRNDKFNSVDQAQQLAEKLKKLNKPFEMQIYKNAGHGLNKTYMKRCLNFFNRKLKG